MSPRHFMNPKLKVQSDVPRFQHGIGNAPNEGDDLVASGLVQVARIQSV